MSQSLLFWDSVIKKKKKAPWTVAKLYFQSYEKVDFDNFLPLFSFLLWSCEILDVLTLLFWHLF